MRLFSIVVAAACVAVAGVGSAFAQPSELIAPGVRSASADGTISANKKGKECYNGTCSGCSTDCSKKKSVRSCYTCCNNNCLGNGAVSCQGYCDGSNTLTSASEQAAALRGMGLLLDQGIPLSDEQIAFAEWISAASDELSVRKEGLALIVDAYDTASAESRDLIEDSFEAALVGNDIGVRETAYIMTGDLAIPVDWVHVWPHLVNVYNAGPALDEHVAAELEVESVSEAAARHRELAFDAMANVLAR